MKIIGIIPARFASTRFPGKPLVNINGKTMIVRVCEQSMKAKKLSKVIVATDDERIADEVSKNGFEAAMTGEHHKSGTDRCAEVISSQKENYDAVINIQGDEPFIHPEQIDLLCSLFEDKNVEIGTLVKKLSDVRDLENPSVMKVVLDNMKNALYFSRSPIPFVRGTEKYNWLDEFFFLKHIGIYGYRTEVLKKITSLAQGKLEIAESLEQLRWLENGYRIRTAFTELESVSIDTPEDLEKVSR